MRLIYAVQTKRGNLNLTRIAQNNLVDAITQLKTALATNINITSTRERLKPDFVMLYASGTINDAARTHISEEVRDARVRIADANDLIPLIDRIYAELWYGIDAQKFPYLRRLKEDLLLATDTIAVPIQTDDESTKTPITDEGYATLYISRITTGFTKKHEQFPSPKFEQMPVENIIAQKQRLFFITGEGGCGKTTALRRLSYKLADQALSSSSTTSLLPVMLKATDIAKSSSSLLESAAVITSRLTPSREPCFSAKDLEDGHVAFMIDALDEVSSDANRLATLDKVVEFHKLYPKCFVIITARDYGYTHKFPELGSFVRYSLTPLGIKGASKIVDYITSGRSLPKESAKEMLRQLQDVHGIGLSPLLVTVFVATSDFSKKDIPPNITAIFKKFTEMMLGRWDQRKGLAQQYETDLKDFLLQRLALKMHVQHSKSIPYEMCKSLISDLLIARGYNTNIDGLFDEVVNRSGLLRIQEGEVEFRHHLLQEFFAGRAVDSADFFASVLDQEWWRKPIVFYFGEHPTQLENLLKLTTVTEAQEEPSKFETAVTLGLAVQACYLSETNKKVDALSWVVKSLAESCEDYSNMIYENGLRYKLSALMYAFIYGRDSVACDPIQHTLEEVEKERDSPERERKLFWCLMGMIEAGQIEKVEEQLRRFRPRDNRLLLGLFLSSFMVANLRITASNQKKAAERVCNEIAPKITGLAGTLLNESKGLLLELHQGELKAIEPPSQDKEA